MKLPSLPVIFTSLTATICCLMPCCSTPLTVREDREPFWRTNQKLMEVGGGPCQAMPFSNMLALAFVPVSFSIDLVDGAGEMLANRPADQTN